MLIQTRQRPILGVVLLAVLICAATAGEALAQEYREPEGTPLPEYARKIHIDRPVPFIVEKGMRGAPELPNVMITGYWPPTNEMLRRFSPDPVQNPDGWIGGNWEGRGFNVYAFFPRSRAIVSRRPVFCERIWLRCISRCLILHVTIFAVAEE